MSCRDRRMSLLIERVDEHIENQKTRLKNLQSDMIVSPKLPNGCPRKYSRKSLGLLKTLKPILKEQLEAQEAICELLEMILDSTKIL